MLSHLSPRRPPKTEETAAEEERRFLGLDASSLRPYIIAIIVAGGVVVALVLVLACLVCHYRNRARERKDYECPQVRCGQYVLFFPPHVLGVLAACRESFRVFTLELPS